MSSTIMKDVSILQLNNEELKIKGKRRASNIIFQNNLKESLIMKKPLKLSKSISKITREKLKKKTEKKGSIIMDFQRSNKLNIQRKKSHKKTVRNISSISKSFASHRNSNKYASMINFPNKEKKRLKKEDIINTEKEKKNNLNVVENSLINKLFNMKFNFQNDAMEVNELINNKGFNKTKTLLKNESSKKNKLYLNINHRKNFANKSVVLNAVKNDFFNSNLTSNRGSFFASQNENNLKTSHLHLYSNEMKTSSLDQLKDISKDNAEPTNKINYKMNQNSNKSNSKYLLEKTRNLHRINNLYDSFDDDESDKEKEKSGNALLPNSLIILIMDPLIFLSTIFCAFYIPLRMAKTECFCLEEENIINKSILYSIDCLYILDFCLSFFRAYYNYQLKLIKNNRKIITHYLKSDFIFDFLEAIPIVSYSNYLCAKNKEVNNCFRYAMSNSLILLKILTSIKIIKIFKIRNKHKNITFNGLLSFFAENYSLENFLDNLIDGIHSFLAFHFFICLNIFLAMQTYPNWLITLNTQDENLLYNYIISCYSLTETLTTVGYGDVVCQSLLERIFQIFFLGVGVIAYSYIITSFGNLIKNESLSSIKYQKNIDILEKIRVDYPNMSYKLYRKIHNYIESRNVADIKMDANILTDSLPFNLRNVLLLIMYSSCIKNFKLFKHVENSNFIIEVLSKIVHATNKKADFLVYEGEMIEEIIIVKYGRLSLEVAIDMEDPESSIEKYFNVNFQGITTDKEMKKIEEAKKLNVSQLIRSQKTKDFDNVKTVLHHAVKKQVNHLLNEGCEDTSILDKTKNDGRRKERSIDKISMSDYLKNEPIRNEKGNFKYIRIIDIRKNENYGGLYMFMRRPSPLSVQVKSKFAELYLIPKKDIYDIANNYNNIWSKIHKKDFHNMLSIKHKTFSILNKYIEFNGLQNVNPNDITNYECALDKSRNIFKSNKINIIPDNSVNPININRNFNPACSPIPTTNDKILANRLNNPMKNNNLFSNKNLNNHLALDNQAYQPVHTEMRFSQLLKLMANGNNNGNNNSNNLGNNNGNNNENNNSNLNTNSNIKSTSQNNLINVNLVINNNNENINIVNAGSHCETKNSDKSFASNFFNDKRKTNKTEEEGTTMIIRKTSEILLPTLNAIFNDDKVKNIRENMKQNKQKEKRRKIFSFGKTTAKLFRNNNYAIALLDKNTGEYFEIENNNDSKIINNDNKNKILLNNIPEISTDDEYSFHHFDNDELSKEGVISFTLKSLYKNINSHTNMDYSKNKSYQEKTLKFLTKLIENKNKNSSSEFDKSSSFSYSFASKNRHNSFNSKEKSKNSSLNIKMFDDLLDLSDDFNGDSFYNSERLCNIKKRRRKGNNNMKRKKGSEVLPGLFSDYNNDIMGKNNKKKKNSIKTKRTNSSKKTNNSKKGVSKVGDNLKSKFTFKLESVNEVLSNNDNNSNNTNPKRNSKVIKKKNIRFTTFKKKSNFINSDKVVNHKFLSNLKTVKHKDNRGSQITFDISNIKPIEKNQVIENKSNIKSLEKSQMSENKSNIKSMEKSQVTENKSNIKSMEKSQVTENKSNIKSMDKSQVTENKPKRKSIEKNKTSENKSHRKSINKRQMTTDHKSHLKSKHTRKSCKTKTEDLNNNNINKSFNYFGKEEGNENECTIL